jgi:predicted metal-dependent peptidase
MATKEVLADAASVLADARAGISQKEPYLVPTVYGFVPHAEEHDPRIKGTLGITKGMVLYYDPVWMAKFNSTDGTLQKKIEAALLHEAQHHVRDHIERGEGMPDQELANLAGDLSINPHLREAGHELPHGVFPDKDFKFPVNLSMEEYYELLTQFKGTMPDLHGVGCGSCGGIAGNNELQAYENELDAKMGRTSVEVKVIAEETKAQINDWVKHHGRGNLAGSLADEIEKNKERSKVRWQDEFRHFFKKACSRIEAGGMDFSMTRPSKRSAARGFPRPGLVAYIPEITFIVDTSASMGPEQLMNAIKEIIGIFMNTGIESAWLIQADTTVAAKKKIRVRDLMRTVQLHGRGGTHFDDALRCAVKLKPKPNLIVYLTDGDGAATYRPPGVEVIWVVVHSPWSRKPEANFGHLVAIKADGKKAPGPSPKRKK